MNVRRIAVGLAVAVAVGCGTKPKPTDPAAPTTAGGGPPAADEATSKERSRANLRKIATACLTVADMYNGHLPAGYARPPQTAPLLGWRVAVLPALGENDLFKKFKLDEPWDGPTNKPLLEKMPAVFAPPAGTVTPGHTPYRTFVGPKTVFPPADKLLTGGGGYVPGASINRMPDGTSNTLLVAEVAKTVPWTKPDELAITDAGPLPDLTGLYAGGFFAVAVDAGIHFIKVPLKEKGLRLAIDPNDGQIMTPDLDVFERPAPSRSPIASPK